MPRRDPETGQFVASSHGSGSHHNPDTYNDIEQVTFNVTVGTDTGSEAGEFEEFELEIVDIDDITDRRREAADLLYMDVAVTSSSRLADDSTAEGFFWGLFQSGGTGLEPSITESFVGTVDLESSVSSTDNLDAIGRPLTVATADDNHDTFQLTTDDIGDPTFFSRNEIELVGEIGNASDESVAQFVLTGSMVFGLRDHDSMGR